MQKIILLLLILLPNYLQAQEFENVLWWKAISNPGRVTDVAISPDGKYFACFTDSLQLFNASNGKFILNFELNYYGAFDISFSKTGKYLYLDLGDHYKDRFYIWETQTGKVVHTLESNRFMYCTTMSPDEKRIALYCEQNELNVYDIETKEILQSKKLRHLWRGGLAYSPDNKYLLHTWVADDYKTSGVYFLDANTLEEDRYLSIDPYNSEVISIEFTRDGKYLYIYNDYEKEMPCRIFTYPELRDITTKLAIERKNCSALIYSKVSDELLIGVKNIMSPQREFFILPKSTDEFSSKGRLPYVPFDQLRESDNSGLLLPAFKPRLNGKTFIDTIGVFFPPWNTTKVKEKKNNNEDKIYPNPSTNSADISFALDAAEEIKIMIYDNSGRLVETLHQGLLEAGKHTFSWDCSNVSSGKYICNIRGNSVFKSLKVVVAR